MKIIKLILVFIVPVFAFGQNRTPACKCPTSMYSGTKADTIFHLSGNASIVLCGGKDTGIIKGKVLYSEFVLSVCGSDKIIKFWGALQLCNLKVRKDRLIVETMVYLPVGKSMAYQETVWTIEHIGVVKNKVVRDSVINPQLPKYIKSQVNGVLNLYKSTPNLNNDKTIELADRLFVSAISNDKKARYYLLNFKNKFTNLDGVYAEEYDTIISMLKLWDDTKHHPVGRQL
jgi:hypothetical protein